MKNEQKYTLEEAYQIILKIKKDSGLLEFQQKEIEKAEKRGYERACNEIEGEMHKRIGRLRGIFGSSREVV